MNLRELVAELECQGKPQGSEESVLIVDSDGCIFEIAGVSFQPENVGPAITWIKVKEI